MPSLTPTVPIVTPSSGQSEHEIAAALARALRALDEHRDPAARRRIYETVVAHVRSTCPDALMRLAP